MKAIRLDHFGGPDVLQLTDIDPPTPGDGEALVQVKACGVCYLDAIVRSGLRSKAKLPLTLGHEVAGVVTAVGPNVRTLAVGDRVASTYRVACGQCRYCRAGDGAVCDNRTGIGEHLDGGYAEYTALPSSFLVKIPDGVAFEQASVCGCVIGAVYNAVVSGAKVRPGETVLVTGSGGGVGSHAVQISQLAGARVIAVTTSKQKVAQIEALGADQVLRVEVGENYSDEIRRLTGGRGADVVIEAVGSATFPFSFRSLAKRGRLVFVGEVSGQPASFNPALMIYKEVVLTGAQSATPEELTQVLNLVAAGKIKPVINKVLPLEEAAQAHQMLIDRSNFGRTVLTVG